MANAFALQKACLAAACHAHNKPAILCTVRVRPAMEMFRVRDSYLSTALVSPVLSQCGNVYSTTPEMCRRVLEPTLTAHVSQSLTPSALEGSKTSSAHLTSSGCNLHNARANQNTIESNSFSISLQTVVPEMQDGHATKHEDDDSPKRSTPPLDTVDPFDLCDEIYFPIKSLCEEVQTSFPDSLGENAWYIVLVS
jgi:hypothetical protein